MREEQVLPGSEGDRRRGGGWGAGGQMAQTMYAHMNKQVNNNKKNLLTPFITLKSQ
jgi:hypothetical protein